MPLILTRSLAGLGLVAGMLVPAIAQRPLSAAEPPASLILRIEAGMHTAGIKGISADAAGWITLTVSDDKTARLWALHSGRFMRVLRPPLGKGIEGKVFAAQPLTKGVVITDWRSTTTPKLN
jgi:hypothetical protein